MTLRHRFLFLVSVFLFSTIFLATTIRGTLAQNVSQIALPLIYRTSPAPLPAELEGAVGLISAGDDIFTLRADGTDLINISNDAALNDYARWSEDGTRILYPANDETHIVGRDGTSILTVTGTFDEETLYWSPDAEKVATYSGNQSFVRITTRNLITNETREFIHPNTISYELIWSPDSTALLYSVPSEQDGSTQIFRASPTGTSAPVQLTHPDGDFRHNFLVGWAADGRMVVYSAFYVDSPGDRPNALFLMNPDGSGRVLLDSMQDEQIYFAGVSPSGTHVAYWDLARLTSTLQLTVVSLTDSSKHTVTLPCEGDIAICSIEGTLAWSSEENIVAFKIVSGIVGDPQKTLSVAFLTDDSLVVQAVATNTYHFAFLPITPLWLSYQQGGANTCTPHTSPCPVYLYNIVTGETHPASLPANSMFYGWQIADNNN